MSGEGEARDGAYQSVYTEWDTHQTYVWKAKHGVTNVNFLVGQPNPACSPANWQIILASQVLWAILNMRATTPHLQPATLMMDADRNKEAFQPRAAADVCLVANRAIDRTWAHGERIECVRGGLIRERGRLAYIRSRAILSSQP